MRRKNPSGAAVAIIAGVAGIAAYAWWRNRKPATELQKEYPTPAAPNPVVQNVTGGEVPIFVPVVATEGDEPIRVLDPVYQKPTDPISPPVVTGMMARLTVRSIDQVYPVKLSKEATGSENNWQALNTYNKGLDWTKVTVGSQIVLPPDWVAPLKAKGYLIQ